MTASTRNESDLGAAQAPAKEFSGLKRIMRRRKPPVKRDATIRAGAVEIVKRGVTRYDFHDPYHIALSMSWKGFALAFVGFELGLNIVFALLYLAQPGCIANARPDAFSDAFFFSLETLATVGYGNMAPATFYGHTVSAVEIISGMAFTAIMTGLLFVRFSRPRPKILFADQAVVTSHNCSPTLMVRIGNGRLTLLTHAKVHLGVLLQEISAEGRSFRYVHDLVLTNSTFPLFALTWTLMHRIDAQSPLAGFDAERFMESDARLFLTIEARDHALGAAVHDMRIYTSEEVLFGMHYAETITFDDQKRPIGDLTRLSLVEPDGTGSC